jgi:DNA-binding transcriptional LysR family regulator
MPWDDRTKRRLKLRDLDILLTVIETGSMGKAAGRLRISQPAISKAIVGLEDALGIKLLDRGRRGVVPTPYGLALAKRGVAIFNDLRQGVQDIDFLSDPTKGEIRIGATEPVAVAFVSPSIDRLSRKYPQTYFHVLTGDGGTLYKNLLDKSIEVAICRMMGPLPEELAAEVVFHDSLVVLSSAKNPLTRRRKLTLAELMDEPWALPPADSFFSSLIDDVFRANGHQPPRSTVATLSEYMRNDLLATGRFLTVLPGFMLKMRGRHSQLKALPVALPNARMPIGIITLKNRTLTPLAQVFIEAIRVTAKSMAQPQ